MGKSEAELRTKHFSAFSNFSKLVLSQSHSKTDIQLKKNQLTGITDLSEATGKAAAT